MKKLKQNTIFLFFFFFLFSSATIFAQISLKGKLTDAETGEPILFGNIALLQKGKLITGVESDFDGNYNISNIDPGIYDVKASYIGYQTQRITDVIIVAEKANKLDIQINISSQVLEEFVVGYKVPLIDQDNTTQGGVVNPDQIKTLPTKNINGLAATSAGVGSADDNKNLSIQSGRSASTDYYVDGIRVRPQNVAPSPSKKPKVKEKKIKIRGQAKDTKAILFGDGPRIKNMNLEVPKEPAIQAGQLTAGEWKDLDNWSFWESLKKDNTYNQYQEYWKFYPQNRYAVKITGEQNQAVIDCTVSLIDSSNQVIWQSKTDNQGRAELWAGVFGENQKVKALRINYGDYMLYEDRSFVKQIEPFAKAGINHIQIPVACKQSNLVDILFAVDATGSMSDEIDFLKAEMKDVIGRTKEDNPDLAIRLGAVFYRDRDYAPELRTQIAPFSEDINQLQQFVDGQRAIGGKTTAEAVDLGLEAALAQNWSKEARSRILFLILDASPHHNPESIASIQKSIRKAAKMGIKIIPITASGIQKDTEFLMKYFSLITNSTYTFLTDHSGIGNSHIKPTAGSYNVETLNDLMLRLILENTEAEECPISISMVPEHAPSIFVPENVDENKKLNRAVKVFPNPAKDYFFLDLKKAFDVVYLFNSEGRQIRNFNAVSKGKTQFDIQDLPPGLYVLHCIKGALHTSKKLVVVKD